MKKNIAQWIRQEIDENREYIIEDDWLVSDYLLQGDEYDAAYDYLSDEDHEIIDRAGDQIFDETYDIEKRKEARKDKERELVAEIVSYIKENYNYKLNAEDFE